MNSSPTRILPPRRTALLATGALLAAVLLAGCGTGVQAADGAAADPSGAGGAYPVTVENCGSEIVVDRAPERVVGLDPSQTELLVRLGVADRLVGQAQVANHPLPEDIADQVAGVPELSTETPPAREDLLAVEPDAVVAPTTYEFTAEQGFASMEQLAQAGAVSYVATGGCAERRQTSEVDDLLTDIANLGAILGVPDEATALAGEMSDRLDAVDAAVAGQERPTVAQLYVEGSTVSAIGAGVEYDIIRRAGGDNVFDPAEDLFEQFFAAAVTPEEIAARNPDVIVFGVHDDAQEAQARDYLTATFPEVTAVREDRLVAVPSSGLFPGSVGNVTAVEDVARAFYPDAF
ncbi:ABC transporter substrate-binding protein [Myceligenerans xiligouense]|uniref:Iron complex transport system substrate-binding protein n=1 Tax=Myceligenerans xiligouense TaxID=253184 RepID=A0A3N4YMR6_9MICO|nr:ABC transporter substrate-binding protein [Myceligenerans xiligouense]RPF20624.1 iron complex transport system substrate-binding protein [Myceligenerans xiligouense]